MNPFDQMRDALEIAKQVQNAARSNAAQMARFLPGNLDQCDSGTLMKLKKELARYNMQTGVWRDAK